MVSQLRHFAQATLLLSATVTVSREVSEGNWMLIALSEASSASHGVRWRSRLAAEGVLPGASERRTLRHGHVHCCCVGGEVARARAADKPDPRAPSNAPDGADAKLDAIESRCVRSTLLVVQGLPLQASVG